MLWILAKALVIVQVIAVQFEDDHPGKHSTKHHNHPIQAVHLKNDVEVAGIQNSTKKEIAAETDKKVDEKTSKKNVMKHSKKIALKHKAKKTKKAAAWSYENTKHWETAFPACRKEGQSPIAITTVCKSDEVGCTPSSQPLGKHVTTSPVAGAYLSNNGHFLELVGPAHFSTVKLGNLQWSSARVQFHTPSEHTMNGQRYPAEIQIVYKPDFGDNKWTLVTSILIEEGYNKNALLSSIGFDMLNLPREEGDKMYLSDTVDLTEGLKTPLGGGFAGYEGTLTSPPCTQDVLWFIAEHPIEASATQIGNLARRYPEGNSRPLFPIGSRMIYRDFNQWQSHASGWSMMSLSAAVLLFAATY